MIYIRSQHFYHSATCTSNIIARYTALCYLRAQCQEDLLHLIVTFDQPLYVKAPSTMRSIPELSSVVACLVGFLLLTSFIDVMRYVMSELLRAQEAYLCQKFCSANDIRPCIQPHTASSFPNI